MKQKHLLIIVIVLALATLSCGLGGDLLGSGDDQADAPSGPSDDQGDSGGQADAPPEPGDNDSPQLADLDELDSYRAHIIWRVENQDGTEGIRTEILQEWVRQPPAQRLVMSGGEQGQEPAQFMEYIVIGEKAWFNVGGTWVESDVEQAEGMTAAWGATTDSVEGWELVGTETVNDVRTKHYRSTDKTRVSFANPDEGGTVKMDIQGETWVADDEGLPPVIIRERMQVYGGFFPLALPGSGSQPETEEGIVTIEYDLTDINSAIIIKPPDDSSELPAEPSAGETPDAPPEAGEPPADQPDLPAPPEETQTKARPADGMMMVYIPLGEFLMGDDGSPFAPEKPAHMVFLEGFWMDQTEVSNAQYRLCVESGACSAPPAWDNPDLNGEGQPVLVPWSGATAYCQWAGGRLPTEAEWEKGARSTDGRKWPWGNQFEENRANLNGDTDGYIHTAPVGMFPAGASPYGLLDMAGNAAEWVADWYSTEYYARSPTQNPTGPAAGEDKVVRSTIANGGGGPEKCRAVARYASPPEHDSWHYGFRCAKTTQP